MLIYFGCLFNVTLFSTFIHKARISSGLKRFCMLVVFATMVLVAGLRGEYVGTDTRAYTTTFTQTGISFFELTQSNFEPGYLILKAAALTVSVEYWALLTSIAIVVVFCYMRTIYKLSVNPAISLFVFITMGYYTFFFNGARQGLACAIYFLSFGAILEGNFRKYLMWVFFAFLFHKTAIFALPFYFLFRQKYSAKFVLKMVVILTFSLLFFDTVLNFGTLISDKYTKYTEMGTSGAAIFLTVFYVLLSCFFVFIRKYIAIEDRRYYDVFMNMVVFGSTIFVTVVVSGGFIEVTRLAFYFQVAAVFLWPIVFKNLRGKKISKNVSIVFVLGHLGYFYVFLDKMGDLVPYEVNENTFLQWFM